MPTKELITRGIIEPRTDLPDSLETAIEAALDKNATHVVVLDLTGVCSFTDRFVICNGNSRRQTQAIADSIAEKMREAGRRASHIEGYTEGNWTLMDYGDFVVHIFTPETRDFYDLERLWRQGKRLEVHEPTGKPDTA